MLKANFNIYGNCRHQINSKLISNVKLAKMCGRTAEGNEWLVLTTNFVLCEVTSNYRILTRLFTSCDKAGLGAQ